MKQILEPVEVTAAFSAQWQFCWRKRCYVVTGVLERWFYRGKWWLDVGLQGEFRTYVRVICRQATEAKAALQRRAGPYSSTIVRKAPPVLGPERVMELFQRRRSGSEDWVLSKVVD
jgi:hypothetical protein